jgi:hypothetical protein
MRACRHDEVPIGGIVGGLIGAIDGPSIGQMRGGQIGGMSIVLLHNGCISPSTHWHVHDASARALISEATPTPRPSSTRFIDFALALVAAPAAWSTAPPAAHPLKCSRDCSALTFVRYMFS